jgi:hypothetical protein
MRAYSKSDHATLTPIPPIDVDHHTSSFHQALTAFNTTRGSSLIFDELTRAEQSEVLRLAEQIRRKERPCHTT